MRSIAFIAAAAILAAAEGAVRFAEPVWLPDLGMEVPLPAELPSDPMPPPRAEAYLVTDDSGAHLEDRYDTFDLWSDFTVRGRWNDGKGNRFVLARLAAPPPSDPEGTVSTRRSFYASLAGRLLDPKDLAGRDAAVFAISPVEPGAAVRGRRSHSRNLRDLRYYPSTNANAIVCAFLPKSPERGEKPCWHLAALETSPDTDPAAMRAVFEDDFLDRISIPAARSRPVPAAPVLPPKDTGEEELLVRDVRSRTVNYPEWHAASSADVLVIDNLDSASRAAIVSSLTNDLPVLRRKYAECVPSPLAGTNAVAVVRVFASREDYLAYVGADYSWTAALWCPSRRELVLCHSEEGNKELLRNAWHEAFHQYLAYAGSMIDSAPWFNEGHARLFEHSHIDRHGKVVFERSEEDAAFVHEYAAELVKCLPEILECDYKRFYAGTQEEIAVRYRLAWSLAYFLEVGAPLVRFRPFESLRADYMKALISTRRMDEATATALKGEKRIRLIAAWLDFWKRD